jgi:hypothetical protein
MVCLCNLSFASDDLRFKLLEEKIQKLEQRLEALEGEKGAISKIKPIQDEVQGQLTLGDWKYLTTKDGHSFYYKITYELFNGFNKGIKLIDGTLRFEDLLGENLYGIKITPDLKIPAQEKVQDSGDYRINQFMNNQHRMMDMDPKDVVAKINIRKIVFEDNTIMEY